ncbi:stalk domain-containing protein [Paenibacillus sp. 1001270B_150601_E10]|uniref:stalk domain-containing protein n=1 Tax=Paenibacillus sp. 1001270B_150601_E10 TaxID=2787079 RepID=UPI00189F4205|nr:stalk domain-containing protein [Paenibacillus sp. 1001270B_150601_E10]
MKKGMAVLMAAIMAFGIGTSAFAEQAAPEVHTASTTQDVAKMYRVPHELTVNLKSGQAKLDGQSKSLDKPILKEGRVYVPLRTLRATGAAKSVTWIPASKQVKMVMNSEINPPFQELVFQVGSDKVYSVDGVAIQDIKIPQPFISRGVTYVPIRALTYLGISPETVNQQVSLKWSNKVIERLQPKWETDKESTTFTVLYEKDLYTPQILTPLSGGAWGGGNDGAKVIEKNISLDGRTYNRIQFTLNLRPGPNPLKLTAISVGDKNLTVFRKVADESSTPVQILEEGKNYIAFDKPTTGYVRIPKGSTIETNGRILAKNDKFDQLTFSIQKYNENAANSFDIFHEINSVKVPIKDQSFKGSLKLQDKGYYLITVYSPAYIPALEYGPTSTGWAEFIVEVY